MRGQDTCALSSGQSIPILKVKLGVTELKLKMDPSTSISYLYPLGLIGSTNGALPNTQNLKVYYSSDDSEWNSNEVDNGQKIEEWGRRHYYDRRSRRSVTSYRQDSISDINWGMTVLANGIKVISAILIILATDDTDR